MFEFLVRFLLFRIGESHKWYSLQARILTIIIDGSELSQRISKFSGSKLGVVHEPILPPVGASGREGRYPPVARCASRF
jgi:hypothetical protein